jgi:histidyl-tRNA synthetase
LRLLDSKLPHEQQFKTAAPRITDHLCDECEEHWAAVQRLLDSARISYEVNPYLVRGLDYYTRTVFEFYPRGASGQQDALASGGRYDGLAEAEGWPPTPGVGFAGGIDRVVDLMAAGGAEANQRPAADVVVLPDGDLSVEAAEVARIIRRVRSTAVDYELRKFPAKMKLAEKLGAKWVAIMTPGQAARKVVRLREVASGDEVELSWEQIPAHLA